MALSAALISNALGFFGDKPKVPTLASIDPDLVQKDTVAGNIANFGDIAKLATSVNTFNQDQLNALLDRALPGAREQIQKNISSQLRGEVPEDVSRAITRYQAGRNVGALTRGSGFAGNAAARDVGLTSLDLINRGLSSAESWLQRAAAPQMDVTSMFFSPQQRLGFAQQQQAIKYERDLLAAQVKAMPKPGEIAIAREMDRMGNTFAQFGMAALGGAMGGGGGAAMGAASAMGSGGGGFGGAMGGSAGSFGAGSFGTYPWLSQASANGRGLG